LWNALLRDRLRRSGEPPLVDDAFRLLDPHGVFAPFGDPGDAISS
jgi:hypothetical protein